MGTGEIHNKGSDGENKYFSLENDAPVFDNRLQSFLQYVENSKSTLNKIQEDVSLAQSFPGDVASLRKAAGRLGAFCIEADEWGFDSLYRVAFKLQSHFVNLLDGPYDKDFWEILNQGLRSLSSILNQCESEYRQRLTVAATLENFKEMD